MKKTRKVLESSGMQMMHNMPDAITWKMEDS